MIPKDRANLQPSPALFPDMAEERWDGCEKPRGHM